MGISDSSQRPPSSISSTILRGVQSHDEEAWSRFYAIWQPIVYALCRRAGVAPQDAEEIVQNVFLKISHGIGGFERQSFRAWIQTITRNTIIDHHRSCQNHPAVFGGTGTWIDKIEDRRGSQDRASGGDLADDDGTMWCLFPNDHEDDNRIEPGRPVTVPGSERGFELQPGPPYGTRVLLALVSSQPLRPTRFGVASLTDRQRFGPGAAGQRLTIVDGSAVERLRAGLKQNPETGAEARVEITTRAGDGAEPGAVGVGEVEEANG